jgi:hypothetical protein
MPIVFQTTYATAPPGANVGNPGADPITITLTDDEDRPIADAGVWISSNAEGTWIVAGTLRTNSSGQVTFLLYGGLTYYLWAQKDGWNPLLGVEFVAEPD